MASNENLWEEEKRSRRRLIKRSLFLASLLLLFSISICFWLTQPLFTKSENRNGLTESSPDRLRNHVAKLSKEFYPRNHQNIQNLNLAADYIRSQFEDTGGKVSEQKFNVNGSTYRNVILKFGDKEERIVIGAHYDAAYDTPGADDNASGVAGLIELAHLLAKERNNLNVEFVAYSLEEPPYFNSMNMGSFVHAKSLSDNNVDVRMMICLEMIGYYSDEPNSQNFPLFIGRLLYPSSGNFTALIGKFSNVTTVRKLKYSMNSIVGASVYSLNAPAFIGGIDLSDHRNYWHFGYDAVMVTDTAFYRNRAYHTLGDTADKLDYVRMAKLIDALNVAVLDASQ